jgi:hypothetical protein
VSCASSQVRRRGRSPLVAPLALWVYMLRKMVPLIPSAARSSGHVGTRMDTISCPFVSDHGPARIQISKGFRAMASRGELLIQSGRGCRNVVRISLVVLAGCGTIFPTSFQSRKGGDMVCVREPVGARVIAACATQSGARGRTPYRGSASSLSAWPAHGEPGRVDLDGAPEPAVSPGKRRTSGEASVLSPPVALGLRQPPCGGADCGG